ncbi:MAG: FG-GAP repeat protein [Anaerolineales bacterium]
MPFKTAPLAAAARPRGRRRLLALAVAVAGWALSAPTPPAVQADPPYAILKTYANPNPAADEEFGNAVAWLGAGDQVVVGARSDQLTGPGAPGAVYILDRDTGAVVHALQKPVPAANDYFGFSVAVSGTEVLVGAPLDDTGASTAGAAYLFDGVTGGILMTYTNPINGAQDRFGTSVAFLTDTVLVGVPQYNVPLNTDAGRAYLCLLASNSCPTILENPAPDPLDNFGLAVVALGDWFAVSAPLDGQHGIVYVYTATTGLLAHTIVPTSTSNGDAFGRSLANVDGNLLIGAPNDDTGANDAGAAYLYSPSGELLQTFLNPDAGSNDTFGAAVAGAGGVVLIGAPKDGTEGPDSGRAYLFDAATGALIDTLRRAPAQPGALFGTSVAIRGESFLIGAPGDDTGADSAGAVYRFGVKTNWQTFLPLLTR